MADYGEAWAQRSGQLAPWRLADGVQGWDTIPYTTPIVNAMGRDTGGASYGQFGWDGPTSGYDYIIRAQMFDFQSGFPRGSFVFCWLRAAVWRDSKKAGWTKEPSFMVRLFRGEASKPGFNTNIGSPVAIVSQYSQPPDYWRLTENPVDGGASWDKALSSVDAQGYICDANYERLALEMWVDYPMGQLDRKYALYGARLIVEQYYYPPTASVSGPVGTLTTNRPTVTWGYAEGAHPVIYHSLFCEAFQVRIIAESVAVLPGFDPETAPAAYDSGRRPYTTGEAKSFTLPVSLEPTSWRVYVRVWQGNDNGYRTQPSTNWPFKKFVVNTAAPPRDPPTIPTNVVAALSDATRARISTAHTPTVQARLYWWDGSASWPLTVQAGSVTLDSRAKIRARAQLTVADSDLVPAAPSPVQFAKPLHPYGSYVHLARGVEGGQLISLGVFRVDAVKVADDGQGKPVAQLDLQDYEAHLIDARVVHGTSRQSWATGTPVPYFVTDVAKQLISEGGLAYRLPVASSERVTANYVNERGDDRVEALRSLAASIGWTTYLTHDGAVYFGPPSDPNAVPKAVLIEGENAIVLSKSFTLSRTDVYDVAAVVNDDANVEGYAYDANPVSPIARASYNPSIPALGYGAFSPGSKPFFFSSPVVTTIAAAKLAALTVLQANALPADRVSVSTVCVPDLRPGDVVTLRRVGDDNAARWWVETVTIPLDVTNAQTMTIVGPPTYVQAVNAP